MATRGYGGGQNGGNTPKIIQKIGEIMPNHQSRYPIVTQSQYLDRNMWGPGYSARSSQIDQVYQVFPTWMLKLGPNGIWLGASGLPCE